jgi:hypothetical protein
MAREHIGGWDRGGATSDELAVIAHAHPQRRGSLRRSVTCADSAKRSQNVGMLRLPSLVVLFVVSCRVSSGPPAVASKSVESLPAPSTPPRSYRARFTSSPPVVDGRLDDAAWNDVAWTDDFLDIEGATRPTPRYRTRAKLLWDERLLYVAAELEEPDVWATLRSHDEIVFHDDDFEIFVDPDGDRRTYYELETNALGTVFDLFLPRTYRDGGPAVHSWNCQGLVTRIDVQGSLNDPRDEDRGWTLEWAIPWNSLVPPDHGDGGAPLPAVDEERRRHGAAPKEGDTWRINFSRVEWKQNFEHLDAHGRRIGPSRPAANAAISAGNTGSAAPLVPYEKALGEKEDNWVWSPQGVVDMHLPERWGEVVFVRAR